MSGREHVNRRVLNYWNWRAETYDTQVGQRGDGEAHDVWARIWSNLFPASEAPMRILDVGAGTGFCSLALAHLGHEITATDLSEKMLLRLREEAAKAGSDITSKRCDAVDIPEPCDPYDGVVARNLLWTLPNPEAALARWREVLRNGGTLVISDGRWNTAKRTFERVRDGLRPGSRDRSGLRFEMEYLSVKSQLPLYEGPKPEEISKMLRDAGFEEIRRWEQQFEEDPFEMEESGFFIVSCRKPEKGYGGGL